MAVYTKKYIAPPGNYYFLDAALANVTILEVTREGLTHSRTFNEQAGDLQYQYYAAGGGIYFNPDNPFKHISYPLSSSSLEKISVKYKV